MKSTGLRKVSVSIAPEAEEPVGALLEHLFQQSPVIYATPEGTVSQASVFLKRDTDWSLRRRNELRRGLADIRRQGISLGTGAIAVHSLRREDWAESWKRHFKPMVVRRILLVKPSWSRRKPAPGQTVVVLDPGLSFGTGQHPTTRFCLEQLVAFHRPTSAISFMDLGTGSGILAIAAARLGYNPVSAVDHDPEAVRIARSNLIHNRVRHAVRLRRMDVRQLPLASRVRYDVVCANLTADLLRRATRQLKGLLRPGGRLVLAGILKSQFPAVRQAFFNVGLRLDVHQTGGEWQSGVFQEDCA